MRKSEFVVKVAEVAGMTQRDTEKVIQVKCKIAKKGDKILNISAEYEDCKQLAQKHNVPLKTIQQTALFLANEELKHE